MNTINHQRFGWSIPQFAQEMGVHDNSVRNWLRDGLLEAVKIGKQWRVLPEHKERFIRNCNLDPQ